MKAAFCPDSHVVCKQVGAATRSALGRSAPEDACVVGGGKRSLLRCCAVGRRGQQVRYHPDRNLAAFREMYEELSKLINAETDRLLAAT